jgi:short-subunit dehydrogenase
MIPRWAFFPRRRAPCRFVTTQSLFFGMSSTTLLLSSLSAEMGKLPETYVLLSVALTTLGVARLGLRVATWLARRFHRQTISRYGAPGTWAVVTGASSGIGEAYCDELAAQGLNLVLISRRTDKLKSIASRVRSAHNVKTKVIPFDFSQTYDKYPPLFEEITLATKDNVGIVVHFAGSSDLAWHFTDKSLQRNIELFRLTAESTLVMLQHFAPLLAHRQAKMGVRGAIVTAGALTGLLPTPMFACSSGNKHYIMALTEGVAREFEACVDIMCAHPMMVESEIVVKPVPGTISAKRFVREALSDLGSTTQSVGWSQVGMYLYVTSLPKRFVQWSFYTSQVNMMSQMLNRPVDLRTTEEKFAQSG